MPKIMPKRILSIDFDYFQQVNAETVMNYYPDGIDLPAEITSMIWGNYYAVPHSKEILESVDILHDEFSLMEDILMNQDEDIPIMIAGSHRHIYDFIHKYVTEGEKLTIVNVDMHHDMFNNNQNVDCGNWLGHIYEEYQNQTIWIANPSSKELYGLSGEDLSETDKTLAELIKTSLAEISDMKFDAVFLCRSDSWLPPHLDTWFEQMSDLIISYFTETRIEKGIKQPRNYKQYSQQVELFMKQNSKN